MPEGVILKSASFEPGGDEAREAHLEDVLAGAGYDAVEPVAGPEGEGTHGETLPARKSRKERAIERATAPLLEKIKQLSDAGAKGTPRVASKLANRLNNVDEELYWDEARRFYSNISRLSANEYNSMAPQMQRAVGQLGRSLGGASRRRFFHYCNLFSRQAV